MAEEIAPTHLTSSTEGLKPKQLQVIEGLRAGNTRTASCAAAGVARQTFYRWMGENVTFCDAVSLAEAEIECHYQNAILQCALGGQVRKRRTTYKPNGTMILEEELLPPDWRAAAWWLDRRRRLWKQVAIPSLEHLSDEQIRRLLADEAERGGEEAGEADPLRDYAVESDDADLDGDPGAEIPTG